jgi:hypothetical protein
MYKANWVAAKAAELSGLFWREEELKERVDDLQAFVDVSGAYNHV